MRVFGSLALLAAVIIVGYSATNLFMAAYTASAEPWQQILAGVGTAAVVAWEAGALLLIGAAWHRGFKPVAVLSSILLTVAMLVTLTWEARIVIGGRADKFASREVGVNKLKGIEDDLIWLRKRRDSLTSRKDLEWITARIEQRERDRDAASAVREVMPEASTAAQMMGGSEAAWRAFLTALPLLFWMLARVTAVPLAMVAFIGKRKDDTTASKSSEAPSIPQEAASPFLEALRAPDPTPPPPPEKATVPVETKPEKFVPRIVEPVAPSVKPRSKAERLEAVDAITRRWISERNVVKASFGEGLPAATVYLDYRNFAGRSAVSNSHFGRSIKRCGFDTKSTATGARYKLAINGKKEAVA